MTRMSPILTKNSGNNPVIINKVVILEAKLQMN